MQPDRQEQPTMNGRGSVRRGSAKVRARERQALAMRTAGETFAAIGAQLGISDRMASRIIRRALDRVVREDAKALIDLEAERLDVLWRAVLPRALAGSARHVEVAVRISERRSRLLGLDAPTATRVEAHITTDEVEALDAEIEALLIDYRGDAQP
jgi:Sigma-70, region 4